MLSKLKLLLKSNYVVFKMLRLPLIVTGYFKKKKFTVLDDFWSKRITMVLVCPDNNDIPRVSNAGSIQGDTQIMHNGIRIHVGSYYGDGNTVLLYKNKGVHEPQEEKVFEEILLYLPEGAVMLELGSFWGFYSMSFQRRIKDGKNYLIEPDAHALLSGKHNFRLNGFIGNFYNYFISDRLLNGQVPTITVDQFMTNNNLNRLHILHSDIQSFEFKMLLGTSANLKNGNIDYLFISTHGNELHDQCKKYLLEINYVILCDANLDQTYSWDGLIVAKHKTVKEPQKLEISLRS